MIQTSKGEMPLRSEHDVVLARQFVRRLSQELKFSLVDQTKLVTAGSELARNALIHGGGGDLLWEVLEQNGKRGIRLRFQDKGPGIANLELALTDGWSSGSGLGLGLSGARRLVHEFDMQSDLQAGTRVTITRWK